MTQAILQGGRLRKRQSWTVASCPTADVEDSDLRLLHRWSRQVQRGLAEDAVLAAGNQPDFHTISDSLKTLQAFRTTATRWLPHQGESRRSGDKTERSRRARDSLLESVNSTRKVNISRISIREP